MIYLFLFVVLGVVNHIIDTCRSGSQFYFSMNQSLSHFCQQNVIHLSLPNIHKAMAYVPIGTLTQSWKVIKARICSPCFIKVMFSRWNHCSSLHPCVMHQFGYQAHYWQLVNLTNRIGATFLFILQLKCCGSEHPTDWPRYSKDHQYPNSCCAGVSCNRFNAYKEVCKAKLLKCVWHNSFYLHGQIFLLSSYENR